MNASAITTDVPLEHAQDFQSAVAAIAAEVDHWFHREQSVMPNLDHFVDAIYLKAADRTMLYGNAAYLEMFSPRRSPVGRRGEAFLDAGVSAISIKTDELILGGADSALVRHVGGAADGRVYEQLTYKQPIPANVAGAVILGITRWLTILGSWDAAHSKSLGALAAIFQEFSRDDRELCRMFAMGESSKDIAEALHCSTRTIENRRARIMSALDLAKPVDIIKLMVRFTDRGLVEFDI